MSMLSPTGSGLPRGSAENDIYTALIVVAFLFVLTATIYVGFCAQTLFGTLLPPAGS